MAKRRKRAKALKTTVKYELYGIVILALSVIALSREGSVSRALTYMFRFLIGVADWVIPVIAIYVGLTVMMKREWPREWSVRKTGFLFILLGYIVINHMSMFHTLDPQYEYRAPGYIMDQTWQSMMQGLHPTGNEKTILQRDVGGGMVGAVLYAALYFLFGDWGARLLVWTFFIIGFLMVTGISVVEAASRMGGRASEVKGGLKNRLVELFGRKKRAQPKDSKRPLYIPEDDGLEEESFRPPDSKKKRKLFFQLFQSPSNKTESEAAPFDQEEEEHDVIVVPKQFGETDQQASAVPLQSYEDEDSSIPYIRDFHDQTEHAGTGEDPAIFANSSLDTPFPKQDTIEQADGVREPAAGPALQEPKKPYILPSFQLLARPDSSGKHGDGTDFKANARKLEATLESFGVRAKVLEVVRGPAVTRYEIQPDVGVKVSRIVSLTDDIALALAAKDIRMEAPIPGKSAIGIEVPNTEVSIVTLREVMESSTFMESPSKLSIAFGRDIAGQPIVANLAKMPHLLVAGATGSGKSVCINGIIASILYKAKPDEVKLLMVDPKMVELNVYNGIPHLLAPVVTDPKRASLALKKVVVEMEKRYELFSKSGTRNIEGYNAAIADPNHPQHGEPLPLIVVIVDELADLMMVAAGDVEDAICRLAQMARAAGIHLIIATQRPSVDVITGVIKANIPSRIAFGVSSQVDSRTILDMAGAEKLLGRGDMLFLPVGASKPIRVQGAFLSDQEVEQVVHFVRTQGQAEYNEDMVPQVEEQEEAADEFADELYDQAVQIVVEAKQASVSLLQRRMRVGYTRAARLIDTMEARGIVGPYEGSKPREVLVSPEQYYAQNRVSS